MKAYLKIASVPVTLLVFSLIYNLLWIVFKLPKNDELISIVSQFLNHYGLWIVFVSAFIEGILIAGNYFPGGLVIFLAVLSSGHNLTKIAFVVLIVTLAFTCSYNVNYILGKYGWYKLLVKFGLSAQLDTAKIKLEQYSFKAIILSYWHPNIGALISTSAGILKMNFIKFITESMPVLLFWNTFWATLVYFLGKQALNLVLSLKYVIPIVVLWILILWVKEKYLTKSAQAQKESIL